MKKETMKTFDKIMKKREELMNECRLAGVATVEHVINGGVYGMLWAVGHEDAPGLPQPHESWELFRRADVISNRYPPVSKLFDYRNHKELYRKCYNWVRDLSRVAQGKICWEDLGDKV